MCGICGFIGVDASADEQLRVLAAMCTTIRHRGPDEQGVFLDPVNGLGLGHQRLSIIDVTGGRQPLGNEDGTVQVVFNGEIYNYKEIRKNLLARGHVFQTVSDTETIVHAYEEWGTDCLQRLRGMFAFAIWDAGKKRLFGARDRVGIKPFYYFLGKNSLIFASEIKAILAHPDLNPEVDPEALFNYLRLFYIPAPQTIYRHVCKLPPGHSLVWENGSVKISRYWALADQVDQRHDADPAEDADARQLRALLQEAVDIRLISEVPLGAFLSGGVDSSIVVALMSRIMDRGVLTHTVGFSEKEVDESAYARTIAERFQCDHSEIIMQADVREILPRLVWHMDEPFADSSMIPTFYICKAARKRVTVCLSGDGGDELFAGYNWYAELQRLQRIEAVLPAPIRRAVGRFGRCLPDTLRGATLLRNMGMDWPGRHINLMRGFSDQAISRLLGRTESAGCREDIHPLARLYDDVPAGFDPVMAAQHVDVSSYMVDDILMKVDKMSMANSLEVRVPLLDHKFVEFAFSLPTPMKINDSGRKLILKEAVPDLIPQEFFERRKQGFSIPQKKWLCNELSDYVEEYLLSSTSRAGEFFDSKEIGKLWTDMNRGGERIDLSPHVWALLCFELWARTFLSPSKGCQPLS